MSKTVEELRDEMVEKTDASDAALAATWAAASDADEDEAWAAAYTAWVEAMVARKAFEAALEGSAS